MFGTKTAATLAAAITLFMTSTTWAVDFDAVQTLQSGVGQATALAFGPEDPVPGSSADGCIYAVDGNGGVTRICFDANKSVTSSTSYDINPAGGTNKTLGITFDPTLPNGEYHMYISVAYSNGGPFNGRIVRAVSTDGGASYTFDESFITGLGRSSFDHQTNGLDFGPDGCLYIAQGNNSNAGYDQDFAESRLSSAVLRACFKDGSGGVDAGFDGNCGNDNTQEACDVEVYASGLRNPYDLEWHSNGSLYCSDNDTGAGFRDNCATNANTFGCPCQDVQSEDGDDLNRIIQNAYYGSPNPYRANPSGLQCQGGSDAGDACAINADCGGGGTCEDLSALCTDPVCGDTVQCYYVDSNENNIPGGGDPNNRQQDPIMPQDGQMDGLIEYRAPYQGLFLGSFCSDWDGDLLATPVGGNIRRVTLSPDGLTGTMIGSGGLNGLSGLDVVTGPDGTVYAATLNSGSITYIVPSAAQPNFELCSPGELCVSGTCQAAAGGCTNPPADDLDCDGLTNAADPCPTDALNRCFGAPPVCGGGDCTLNEVVRLDIGGSAPQTDCAGDTWHADTGNGNNTSGNASVTTNPITDVFGCSDAATELLIQTYKFGTNIADPQALPNGGLERSYVIPNGTYVVNLLFAEVFQPVCDAGGGGRTSDVYIEGALVYGGLGVADGVDPYGLSLAQNGAADACGGLVVRAAVVAVTDGALDIIIQEDGPSGDADFNAGVQAIEVIGTAPSCSVDGDCDDGNSCTTDSCVAGQCDNVDVADGTACDDGNGGTFNDMCTAGVCSGTTDDPDNDGLSGPNDPCPSDPRNQCYGTAAVDGTVGNPIRINASIAAGCGGDKIDCNGDMWFADFGFNQGNSTTCNLGGACAVDTTAVFGCDGGDDETDDIFQCERWDATAVPELIYSFDLPNGTYMVNLLFMNSFTGTAAVGQRVFDINIEGALVFDDFDQVDAAGGSGIPVVRAAEITVSDGDGLQVELIHGVENPAIKGIEVLQQGGGIGGEEAFLQVAGNSTFGSGSFTLQNTSTSAANITAIEIDLSTTFLPDIVFDPIGAAGDATAKCLEEDSGGVATGYVTPTDNCVDPFAGPHDGGFDSATLQFTDFNPTETMTFSVDIDPTSIQGAAGAGGAGSVSGFELSAATVTVTFDTGAVITSNLFRTPASNDASQNIFKSGGPNQPGIALLGVTPPTTVNSAAQTVQVTGPNGSEVRLLVVEGSLDNGVFDIDPFEANTEDLIQELTATIVSGGSVDIPITLTDTTDGLNHIFAAFVDPDMSGRTGPTSAVLVVDYEPAGSCTMDADCDDLNECTTDTCPAGLCVFTPVADGTACTSDLNDCTTDTCQAGACANTPVTDGTTCDDGLACTDNDACLAGLCSGADNCPAGQVCSPFTGLCAASDTEAFLVITPTGGIGASAFNTGSFQLTNNSPSGEQITRIEFNLLSGIYPDVVFDPIGGAGDVGAKCLTADSNAALVGYIAPADACVDPFASPHDGGYDIMEVVFGDFDPGETFTFSVDNDPTSIQGGGSTGSAGSISGLEMCGMTVTVEFDNGDVHVAELYRTPASVSGSQNDIKAGGPVAPAIDVLGIVEPALVGNPNQTVRVSGPIGAAVRLLQLESELLLVNAAGFDLDPFEANAVVAVFEYFDTVGPSGFVDVPVVLTQSACSNGGAGACADVGLNYFVAVIEDALMSSRTSPNSNVSVLQYDPTITCVVDADCEDGNECTTDTCTAGACSNVALSDGIPCSDDLNVCTVDVCLAGVCGHPAVFDGTACDDGVDCTESDECTAGVCGGTPNDVLCDDINECTVDSCDAALDCQNVAVSDGTACDDGLPCTVDSCQAGACVSTPDDGLCDDTNQCTLDACNAGICDNAALSDGTPCDDGNPGTPVDQCIAGTCVGNARVTVALVAVPTPTAGDEVGALPASTTTYNVGDTFHIEVWAQTIEFDGLSSVTVDLGYDAGLTSASGLTNSAVFNQFTSGTIDNGTGTVDDVGGSHPVTAPPCSDQVGFEPSWARVATIDMVAVFGGSQTVTVGDAASLLFGTAICDVLGNVDPAEMFFESVDIITLCQSTDATCDGIDDDCDGQTDDDYVATPTACGVGACADTGTLDCIGGSEIDSCLPGTPTAEVCDGADNNCDGTIDEEPDASASCTAGDFCAGTFVCSGGSCVPDMEACPDECESCNPDEQACGHCIFDHNLSGAIDGLDFAFFSGCFGGCYTSADSCFAANYDGDGGGCVGGGDFGVFSGCFGLTCGECPLCFPWEGGPAPEGPTAGVTRVAAVAVARPSEFDFEVELPAALKRLSVGQTFYVELWARADGFVDGLASAYVDVVFDPATVDVRDYAATAQFPNFSTASELLKGRIAALGGCAQLGDGTLGFGGEWVRLGVIEFVARRAGQAPVFVEPAGEPFGVSIFARPGDLEPAALDLGGTSVTIEGGRNKKQTR